MLEKVGRSMRIGFCIFFQGFGLSGRSENRSTLTVFRDGIERSAFVFHKTPDSNLPIASIDSSWRAIRKQIGLPEDIRLHDLRHTYASHAIMTGETLNMVGQLLGHKRSKTTEIYSHIDAQHLAMAPNRVGGLISSWLGRSTHWQ